MLASVVLEGDGCQSRTLAIACKCVYHAANAVVL